MQPPPRRVPVEAGAPPTCQRTASENGRHDESIPRYGRRHHRARRARRRPARHYQRIDLRRERARPGPVRGEGEGVLAGLPFAEATFRAIDATSLFDTKKNDGDKVEPGDVIAEVESSVIALLSGERTALNLLQRASGIATTTKKYVDAVAGTNARIYDTRKTAPGLRELDKYAVRCGGGENHRIGLFDMFLIKNNHVDRAGSITNAVERIRRRGLPQKIMVEVRDMRELEEALNLKPDFILLDNMTPGELDRK